MPLSITAAVGDPASPLAPPNNASDVRTVQSLLAKTHRFNNSPNTLVAIDGLIGPRTVAAIRNFQQTQFGSNDGVVQPAKPTLNKLNTLADNAPAPTMVVLQPGEVKPNPYTIVIAANPVLEAPLGTGTPMVDPMIANPAAFALSVTYLMNVLFGGLPSQGEKLLGHPAVGPRIRVVTVFQTGLATVIANALVAQDSASNMLIARQPDFVPLLAMWGLKADVAFAVSASTTHNRATAWPTRDDDTSSGVSFFFDGVKFSHRHHSTEPGATAVHTSSNSLTGLHEFGHAASSYTNGFITDQYVNVPSGAGSPPINKKAGSPIPPEFAEYNTSRYLSDLVRDGLGYPATWTSYHPELTDPGVPSLMDNYPATPAGRPPEACVFDRVTRQFLLDRILAKMSR